MARKLFVKYIRRLFNHLDVIKVLYFSEYQINFPKNRENALGKHIAHIFKVHYRFTAGTGPPEILKKN